MSRAQTLIRKLKLTPHPEGGHYREIHRAAGTVKTPRGSRSAATLIWFLPLVACAVGPGFDFKDFAMLRDDAKASARLRKAFPALADAI
jgi:predicted cupin superfamily sugar epimerase